MEAIITFLAAAIVAGTPLLFATVGEIITERVGNLNLGVEGMMLMGAVIGFLIGLTTGNAPLAMTAAALAGSFGAAIYAFLTITFRANQVVTGLALTIFGTGFSTMIGNELIGEVAPASIRTFFKPFSVAIAGFGDLPSFSGLAGFSSFVDLDRIPNVGNLPLLSDIPVIGEIFFRQDMFVYFGYLMAIVVGIYLYRTRFGLNVRAIGENPAAADSSSLHVGLYKYIHVLAGGAMCGLAGAYLSLVYVPAWQENVTAGRGWIAIALVIFSGWNPYKALFGAFLFGGLDIIGFRLQGSAIQISQYIMDMLPYLVTILVLVLSTRKFRKNAPPKSLGVSYFREER